MKQRIINLIVNSILILQKANMLPNFDIPNVRVDYPKNEKYGDYSSGVALEIARIIKKKPVDIAEMLKSKIDQLSQNLKREDFKKVEVANPGFINFFLSEKRLVNEIQVVLIKREKYGSVSKKDKKRMVIDYSSPNIAKPFGIGHLRSTIIGQAICNIYRFLDWDCIGDNHLGDWGTQFGKLIYQIREKKLKEKSNDDKERILKNLTIKELEKLYIDFHKTAKINPKMEDDARNWFRKLENGDEEAQKIWQVCRNVSLKEFSRIYNLLGIKIDYILGESFYRDKTKDVIREAEKKRVAVKSHGALIIKYPKNEFPPVVLLKSDGATTYLSRDLAAVKYRLEKWDPNLIIYEAGEDQSLYFRQLFRAVELLGWANRDRFVHIAHGLVRWKHSKFSTRKGDTIHLESVLKEAIKRSRNIISESGTGRNLTEKEKEDVARLVGIGAIKYNDLSQHYSRDIIFDWDRILNLKGDSGPYIQYTYARCISVIKNSGIKDDFNWSNFFDWLDQNHGLVKIENSEFDIMRMIIRFPEIVQESADCFSPNLICNFIFPLAQKYNLFYNLCPIINAGDENKKLFRLAITFAVKQIIKNSLLLLGIASPERM